MTLAPGEHPGHATRLLAMADELLARARPRLEGARAGRRRARAGRSRDCASGSPPRVGWPNRWSVELVGVSSLRALAGAAHRGRRRQPRSTRWRCSTRAAARRSPRPIADQREVGQELVRPARSRPRTRRHRAQAEASAGATARQHGVVGGRRRGGALSRRARTAGVRGPRGRLAAAPGQREAICGLGARRATRPRPTGDPAGIRRRPDAEIALERAGGGERGSMAMPAAEPVAASSAR